MRCSPHSQELNKVIGGEFAIGARDIEMGNSAHRARAKRRDQHAHLLSTGDDRRRVGCSLLRLKDHYVALPRWEIKAAPSQPGEPFRQESCVGVILSEASEVVVE